MILPCKRVDLYVLALAAFKASIISTLLPAAWCGTESAFEMSIEMALIAKADGDGDISGRHSVAEHILGAV